MRIIVLSLIVWNVFLQINLINLTKQLEVAEPDESIVLLEELSKEIK